MVFKEKKKLNSIVVRRGVATKGNKKETQIKADALNVSLKGMSNTCC
jgi:hypothetical protein